MWTVCVRRNQIERNAGGSNQSPRSVEPERAQETPEPKSDTKSEGDAAANDGRLPADGRTSNSTINPTGQPRKKRNAGSRGDAARHSEEEKDGSGTEHDPLIAPGRSTAEKSEGDDYNNGGPGRSISEDIREEHNNPVENAQKTDGGDDETGDTLRASTDGGLLEDAAGGDGGRFQGMRSRMKKAGKGLLAKKAPGLPARRRKGAEDAAPGGVGGKDEEQPEAAEGTNPRDALPDAGGKGRTREAGDGDDNDGGQPPPKGPADESDTARCACCCF